MVIKNLDVKKYLQVGHARCSGILLIVAAGRSQDGSSLFKAPIVPPLFFLLTSYSPIWLHSAVDIWIPVCSELGDYSSLMRWSWPGVYVVLIPKPPSIWPEMTIDLRGGPDCFIDQSEPAFNIAPSPMTASYCPNEYKRGQRKAWAMAIPKYPASVPLALSFPPKDNFCEKLVVCSILV